MVIHNPNTGGGIKTAAGEVPLIKTWGTFKLYDKVSPHGLQTFQTTGVEVVPRQVLPVDNSRLMVTIQPSAIKAAGLSSGCTGHLSCLFQFDSYDRTTPGATTRSHVHGSDYDAQHSGETSFVVP